MNSAELILSLEIGFIYGIVALGIYFSFRVLDFADLTCDGSFVLGAAISSIALKSGCDPYVALGLAILGGTITGLCTGMLNIYFKVSAILSGILIAFMLYSINLRVMQGVPNLALINEVTIFTGQHPVLVLAVISGIICLLCSYLLVTNFGLALRSCGQNKRLSLNNGVNIKLMTLTGLAISNALIALGGGLFSQHQGFVDVTQGVGTIIIGLAAVMIGEKVLPFRSPWLTIFACLLGSFIYRVLVSFALHNEALGLATQDLNLITGLMIIAVMLLPRGKYVKTTEY